MSAEEIGGALLAVCALLVAVTLVGHLFTLLHQPRVVGEICGGILVGPETLGRLAHGNVVSELAHHGSTSAGVVSDLLYNSGLLCLMFIAGASIERFLSVENRRATVLLLLIGTVVPFGVTLLVFRWLPTDGLAGSHGSPTAVALIAATSAAVMSIPVISKIFQDLGIAGTRFASLLLGVAVLEDIALWAVVALAVSLTGSEAAAGGLAEHGGASRAVVTTLAVFIVGVLVMPPLLRPFGRSRWNTIAARTPLVWIILVLMVYTSASILLHVTTVFAAFLAGFAVVGGWSGAERPRFEKSLSTIEQIGRQILVPLYFGLIGMRLRFSEEFSVLLTVGFMLGSSLLVALAAGLASFLAGFRGRALLNISITRNARGGPGIVLAGVALDASIINATFFTALVVTAIVTSAAAGAWLEYVTRRGLPLLDGEVSPPPEATRLRP